MTCYLPPEIMEYINNVKSSWWIVSNRYKSEDCEYDLDYSWTNTADLWKKPNWNVILYRI